MLFDLIGCGRRYQLYAIHTSKACNILSKYTAFVPIDLDTNEYLQTSIEYMNAGESDNCVCAAQYQSFANTSKRQDHTKIKSDNLLFPTNLVMPCVRFSSSYVNLIIYSQGTQITRVRLH